MLARVNPAKSIAPGFMSAFQPCRAASFGLVVHNASACGLGLLQDGHRNPVDLAGVAIDSGTLRRFWRVFPAAYKVKPYAGTEAKRTRRIT